MTYTICSPQDLSGYGRRGPSRALVPQVIAGSTILAVTALLGSWMLLSHPISPPDPSPIARRPAPQPLIADNSGPGSSRDAGGTATPAQGATYSPLLDPDYAFGSSRSAFSQSAPLAAALTPVLDPATLAILPAAIAEAEHDLPRSPRLDEIVPLPPPRPAPAEAPAEAAAPRSLARRLAQAAKPVVAAPGDHRSFFEKLFSAPQPAGTALAYAAPEDSFFGRASRIPLGRGLPPDRFTAVYDISAHTVYLPNGVRLEAHSGLGPRIDDPRYITEHMRGPTPPATYELTLRESLFHGVQALRLTPVEGDTFGRTGLLAHTFMLGPNGQSNGCVSFRNYNAFLQSYRRGEIRRLVVVAHLG